MQEWDSVIRTPSPAPRPLFGASPRGLARADACRQLLRGRHQTDWAAPRRHGGAGTTSGYSLGQGTEPLLRWCSHERLCPV